MGYQMRYWIHYIFLLSALGFAVNAAEVKAPASADADSSKKTKVPMIEDEVVVKGDTIRGEVLKFDESGISIRTKYGSGDININYKDIESLKTYRSYLIAERNGKNTHGRIVSVSGKQLIVMTKDGDLVTIDPADISRVVLDYAQTHSFYSWLRDRYPFTTARLDLNWYSESGSLNKVTFEFGLNIERRKTPTRFVFDIHGTYETEQTADVPKHTTKDEFRTYLIGEYDLNDKWYLFLFPSADRDAPRGIDLRFYPATGIGYRLLETAQWRLQVQTGLAYVYEMFVDYPDNKYVAGHLGVEGGYTFKNGNTLTGKIYMYPGLSQVGKNWLFRAELLYVAKITDFLALNMRISETLDNNPAPDVGDNKLTTSIGLSLTY